MTSKLSKRVKALQLMVEKQFGFKVKPTVEKILERVAINTPEEDLIKAV
jgi:citrate lyase gamma subunit